NQYLSVSWFAISTMSMFGQSGRPAAFEVRRAQIVENQIPLSMQTNSAVSGRVPFQRPACALQACPTSRTIGGVVGPPLALPAAEADLAFGDGSSPFKMRTRVST